MISNVFLKEIFNIPVNFNFVLLVSDSKLKVQYLRDVQNLVIQYGFVT